VDRETLKGHLSRGQPTPPLPSPLPFALNLSAWQFFAFPPDAHIPRV